MREGRWTFTPPCCRGDGRHLTLVTAAGRRRYWVRCWSCRLEVGPFRTSSEARAEGRRIELDEMRLKGLVP